MKLLLALFICFVIAAPEVQGCTHYITATGTVKCKVDNQYKPLPLVKVELLDDDGYLGNQRMADGRTNSNGEFSLTGSGRDIFCGKPDPKIKVVYDYSGSYGTMRIRNPLGQTRDHLTDKKRYSRYVTFNINIDDEHCRAYYRFYHCGLKYYYSTVQSKPPYGTLYVTTRATAVTPYAPHTKIKVPHSEDPISCETAKHEFAHTIRHHYDGTYEHFLSDAGRFWYLRSHGCTDDTNAGFAFNEGWAEYWEDSCTSKLPLALTIGNKRNIMCHTSIHIFLLCMVTININVSYDYAVVITHKIKIIHLYKLMPKMGTNHQRHAHTQYMKGT